MQVRSIVRSLVAALTLIAPVCLSTPAEADGGDEGEVTFVILASDMETVPVAIFNGFQCEDRNACPASDVIDPATLNTKGCTRTGTAPNFVCSGSCERCTGSSEPMYLCVKSKDGPCAFDSNATIVKCGSRIPGTCTYNGNSHTQIGCGCTAGTPPASPPSCSVINCN